MTMHQRSRKGVQLCGAFIALALVAAACGDDDDDDAGDTSGPATAAATDTADATDTTAASDATDTTATPDTTAAPGDSEAPAGDGIKLGIMAECEGAFGGFNEDVVAGVTLAMINEAGATSNSRTTALEGFSGATAGGLPIEVVSVGCG